MIIRQFGVEERAFVIRGRAWREIEKSRDCGLGILAARLAPLAGLATAIQKLGVMNAIAAGCLGAAKLDDVRAVLLWSLADGGLGLDAASALIRNVFDDAVEHGMGPMVQFGPLAFDLVTAAYVGLPDEPREAPGEPRAAPGEPRAAAVKTRRRSTTARPASPASTARSVP